MVLEYFGENSENYETSGQCCDICKSLSAVMVDCLPEMQAVVQAVNELPGSEEKKVSQVQYTHMYVL